MRRDARLRITRLQSLVLCDNGYSVIYEVDSVTESSVVVLTHSTDSPHAQAFAGRHIRGLLPQHDSARSSQEAVLVLTEH